MAALSYTHALDSDVPVLAKLNEELLQAQNVESGMTLEALEVRMREFLAADYQAVLFVFRDAVVGYALFKLQPKFAFIRHIYVNTDAGKKVRVETAFQLLRKGELQDYASIRLDVPEGNKDSLQIWESIGFQPRSVRLELETATKSGTRKSCGAVIYRRRLRKPEFLVVLHEKGRHWGFPKGHANSGETEMETAVREIKEETGLHVTFREDFYERVYFLTPKERRKEVVFFLSRVGRHHVQVDPAEIREYRWLSYWETRDRLTYENSKLVLDKAYDYLKERGF
ncbi:MAG: NUDIX domain-containing protein [Spirochaetales bacterium]